MGDAPFTDVERWLKLPRTGSDPDKCQFLHYRGASSRDDDDTCTLCGASVPDLTHHQFDPKKAHRRWHAQLALVEEIAGKYFGAKGELEMEQAKADTVALRAELADNRLDIPVGK